VKAETIWPGSRMARIVSQKPVAASKLIGPATMPDGKIIQIVSLVREWRKQGDLMAFRLWDDPMDRTYTTGNRNNKTRLRNAVVSEAKVIVTLEKDGQRWLVKRIEGDAKLDNEKEQT
jgi:hypothetical protein